MKRTLIYITTFLAVSVIFIINTAQKNPENRKFYYAFNEKIFIEEITDKFVVKFKDKQKTNELKPFLIEKVGNEKAIQAQNEMTVTVNLKSTGKTISEIVNSKTADIAVIKPAYKFQNQEMYYTNEILVEPQDGILITTVIEKLNLKAALTIKSKNFHSVLEVSTSFDACDIANRIQESGMVKFSHPNFIMPVERHQVIPNDTYFNNQFYLRNTGQVFNPVENHFGLPNADINVSFAWNTTTGINNIIVAVIDEGVTPNHPDLPNARQLRLNGSNFVPGENVNDPTPGLNNNHGNSCAGIIAATQNNNEGISGIAPNVRIMPIKVFGQNANADNNGFAAAIDFGWQNGAHVISNSWGYGSDNPNFVPAIVAAINRAVTQGRGNLGSVVVFSASNSANHSLGNNGQVRFPSNVQINGVLTVGASERDDEQSDYSPTSNAANPNNQIIDIVAPSHRAYPPAFGGIPGEGFEVWTIDIPGVNGYNQWNDPNFPITAPAFGEILPTAGVNNLSYTGRMGGTSASCPQVAAVAALVLSLNNNLTQQQVFDIITQSAEDVGGYAYNANGWCPELGNGRLNACAALSRIPNRFSITGAGIFCNSSPYSISGLPQGSTVIWASLNPTVATISSTGVASRVSDGSVIFTATINIPNRCGNTTVTSNTITVGTGNSINFTQKTITCVNSKPYFFGAVAPVPFASNYVWYSKDESNPNNPFILRQSENSNTADFPLGNNKGNRYYTIRVIVTNPCGNKQSIDADGYIFAPSCSGLRVSATPNPTNNTMSIKVVNQQGLISADPNEKIYKLQVVDKLGTTHKEYKFSGGLKQTNINIGNLHSDIYILRIFDGTEWTSIQIIKN